MLGERDYSIGVFRISVLIACLAVMTGLAECLPVGIAPHQCLITPMGNDVIDYRCSHKPTVSLALHTKWVLV